MKFKHLSAIVLLSFGLIACDNNADHSGTYVCSGVGDPWVFEKIENNKYKVTTGSVSYMATLENKNSLYTKRGGFVGEFKNKDEFVYTGSSGKIFVCKKVK